MLTERCWQCLKLTTRSYADANDGLCKKCVNDNSEFLIIYSYLTKNLQEKYSYAFSQHPELLNAMLLRYKMLYEKEPHLFNFILRKEK